MLSSPTWSTINTAVSKNNNDRFNRRNDNAVTDYHLKQQQHIHEFSVTGTPKPATTNLNDIFITVKTTKLYHDTRLTLIIKTWFQLAKDQVSWKCLITSFRSDFQVQCTCFVIRAYQSVNFFVPANRSVASAAITLFLSIFQIHNYYNQMYYDLTRRGSSIHPIFPFFTY